MSITSSDDATRRGLTKVPEVTIYFWITKVLTTGMGETTSDYLVRAIPRVLAVVVAGVILVIALAWQFSAKRYVVGIYWFAVAMVSVFGTMIADALHIQLKIPYAVSTPAFAIALAAIFVTWYGREKTLSIHSINTRSREAFYWATVMATFALGTAAGDLTAVTFHLGYFSSAVMFAVVIAVPALSHWRFGLNSILAFWFAYIVTRPLGASLADWVAVSHRRGGLAWGDGPVSLGLTVVIVGFVAYLAAIDAKTNPAGRRSAGA
jgi:uncharacterized membrane-anchored protein